VNIQGRISISLVTKFILVFSTYYIILSVDILLLATGFLALIILHITTFLLGGKSIS
jgi:hypothetical protein